MRHFHAFTRSAPFLAWLIVPDISEAGIKAVLIAPGFSRPVFVCSPPDDHGRLFVVEQHTGRIRIIKNGSITGTFLTVPGVTTGGEQGLLGLAFHPNYASNRKFYVYYTTTGGGAAGRSVVAEYLAVTATSDLADAGSARTILRFDQPQSNHNAGWIGFGPNDGYLYIASGDGGGGGDAGSGHTEPGGNAQDITSNWLGKILRVDVNDDDFEADDFRNYKVPTTNPLVGLTGDDEIWAYGLRNPWRDSFDRQTGDFYIADVGQDFWEELNYQPASSTTAKNYGWRLKEATHCHNPSSNCDPGGLTEPIYEYGHTTNTGNPFSCGSPPVFMTGFAVVGGYVYRGSAIPEITGRYFFADNATNTIMSFHVVSGAATNCTNHTAELAPGGGLSVTSISSFGEDAQGEIYMCDLHGGEIFKIVRNPPLMIGDFDGDNDVDVSDFGLLQRCLSGSGIAPSAGCAIADLQNDNDVDSDDFGVFLPCLSGANVAPPVSCQP